MSQESDLLVYRIFFCGAQWGSELRRLCVYYCHRRLGHSQVIEAVILESTPESLHAHMYYLHLPRTQLHVGIKAVIIVGPARNGVCSFSFPAMVEHQQLVHILIGSSSPASPTRNLPLRSGFLCGFDGTYRTRLCFCIATAACRSSADPLLINMKAQKVPYPSHYSEAW